MKTVASDKFHVISPARCREMLIAAHRAGDQEAMRKLSQIKERLKQRRYCPHPNCGVRISATAKSCAAHKPPRKPKLPALPKQPRETCDDLILRTLNGSELSPQMLRRQLPQYSARTIKNRLDILLLSGRVSRPGHGCYRARHSSLATHH